MTLLSKTECSALRGIAIIGIFMHNFLHWLSPMVKENEYQFHQSNVDWFLSVLCNPTMELPLQLFSFFGHYGVPVFLFLSGYGLVLKYENSTAPQESTWEFTWKHYMKLFPMMILGFTCFAMVDWITPSHHHWAWEDLLALLTMTINLFPDPDHIIWPGPYWFFGLMMQLYILYRLVFFRRNNRWVAGAIVVCWIIQMACFMDPEGDAINRIRYNSIGGMLPFGIGLLLARYEKSEELQSRIHAFFTPTNSIGIFIVCLAVIIMGSLNFHSWLGVPAFVVVLHISFIKMLRGKGIGVLDWTGVLSSAVFVCHPITRKIFIPISRSVDTMDGLVLYIITTIVMAMMFQRVLNKK